MTPGLDESARHEVLDETDRDEGVADLDAWPDRVTAHRPDLHRRRRLVASARAGGGRPTEVTTPLADAVRRARTARGLRQRDLAARAGVSQAALSKWELGASAPSLVHVGDLERALDLRPGALLAAAGLVGGAPADGGVEGAIERDPALDEAARRILKAAYRAAIGR